MNTRLSKTDRDEFLKHSNYIEREYSDTAFEDAVRAWEYAIGNMDRISVDYLLKIHKRLQKRLRPDIAGKLRNCDVWIGGRKKMFISESLIKEQLEVNVLSQIRGHIGFIRNRAEDESFCEKMHKEFENIHPFEDGNGRVGRILWNIHRLSVGLPIKIIHEGDEQMEYYKMFNKL